MDRTNLRVIEGGKRPEPQRPLPPPTPGSEPLLDALAEVILEMALAEVTK